MLVSVALEAGPWEPSGLVKSSVSSSLKLPIRPRTCDCKSQNRASNTVKLAKLEQRGTTKNRSKLWKVGLWVMLSLCFSHVANVANPFCSSVFHFLAKLSEIFEIFFLCGKENNEVKLVTQECKHIQPQHYSGRDHETWSELSKFSSYLRSS